MENSIVEATFPLAFRTDEAGALGKHLKNRHSVVLIGMKRVGISNFLRFFLYHQGVVRKYISETEKHMFIPIDLIDLVEREAFPFWTLTLKRIVDTIEKSSLDQRTKKYVETLFLDSIQSKDLFLLIDSVSKSLTKIVENNIFPTLFFIRFDRVKDAVTSEFFDNLQGLKDATHEKLSYVFTSFRGLDALSPSVFTKYSLSMFAQNMYIKPARKEDTEVIFSAYKKRYNLVLADPLEKGLFDAVDGYIQHLQLALVLLREQEGVIKNKEELFERLGKDERITLQSEELWESLTVQEQIVLSKISIADTITDEERQRAKYLWDTGFVYETKEGYSIFSMLFQEYLKAKKEKTKTEGNSVEFSKKEHLLFTFLESHTDEVCEREKIIEAVWPEVEALGVSDWAIDRLVARVRNKLKVQNSPYEIQTIKTRGYKIVKIS